MSRNPCSSQRDNTGARWHGETDEEMVPGWHASAFLRILATNAQIEFPERNDVDDTSTNQETIDNQRRVTDVYEDTTLLSYLQTGELAVG